MHRPRLLSLVLGTILTATVAASALAAAPVQPPNVATKTIVGIVLTADGEFDVLQAAVVKAGLVDALNGRTQYTVFAPTDAAFVTLFRTLTGNASLNEAGAIAAINSGSVNAILTDVLLYHVVEGRRFSNSVLPKGSGAARTVETLGGQTFTVSSAGRISTASGGSASIVTANVNATNGVIHVVNAVLVPDLD